MRKITKNLVKTVSVLGVAVFLIGLGGFGQPEVACAQNEAKRELPRLDGETRPFPGYPYRFDGVGPIDRLGAGEIVIGDVLFSLPSGAELHTPRSRSAGIGSFAEDDYVGFKLDESGAIESLWLLQKGKR